MKRLSGKWLALLFLLPFTVFFVIFQTASPAWVALNSLKASDAWSLANYLELLGSPFYRQAIRHNLEIAGWSSLLGLLITVLDNRSLCRVGSRLYDFVMAFSNMASNFARMPLASVFIILLGFNGALTLSSRQAGWVDDFNLYSKTGLIIFYTYLQIPLGVMLLYLAFNTLHEDWHEPAALLGANGWQYWWYIGIPVLTPVLPDTFVILLASTPGVYAMMYSLTIGNLSVTPIRIDAPIVGDVFPNPNMASALAMALIDLMTLITLVHQQLLRKSYHVAR